MPDPAMQETGALTETPLSGCHCVCLLPFLSQSSLPSLTHLLAALLPPELAGVPRGTVSTAMRQCQAPTPLEKAVRGVEPLLRGLCLACQERDTAHGLVAGEETTYTMAYISYRKGSTCTCTCVYQVRKENIHVYLHYIHLASFWNCFARGSKHINTRLFLAQIRDV